MTKIYDGGPAFPIRLTDAIQAEGMSLLDYFAGQALGGSIITTDEPQELASHAYEVAEAMLAERAKRMSL